MRNFALAKFRSTPFLGKNFKENFKSKNFKENFKSKNFKENFKRKNFKENFNFFYKTKNFCLTNQMFCDNILIQTGVFCLYSKRKGI